MRIHSILSFSAIVLIALAPHVQAQDNLLLIVADDVGVDSIGVYAEGADPPATPHIDLLASEGVLFRNAWANPTCSPTRAAMLTGRHGFRTGLGMIVSPAGWYMQDEELTFVEVLRRFPNLARRSALIGKWHLSNIQNGYLDGPLLQGFDQFTGSRENIREHLGYRYDKWLRVSGGVESLCTTYATTQQVDDAIGFMSSAPEPWICVLNFNAPHEPFHRPPQDLFERVLPSGDPRFDPPPFYKAAVEAMDHEIGRLFSAMGTQVLNTNIVFTADNGTPRLASEAPFLPTHAKLSPYEGGLNVPLIVWGPIVDAPGREVHALVSATDLHSTALELCGVQDSSILRPGNGHDSISIVSYLKDATQRPIRDHVYAEMFSPNGPAGVLATSDVRAIRGLRYKIIRRGPIPGPYEYEFYDLEADPFEESNLLHGAGLSWKERSSFMRLFNQLGLLLG